MALGIPDELLPVFAPIAVYWLTSGIYHLLLSRNDNYRLYTRNEEKALNMATKRQALVGVLLNQGMQMALVAFMFMVPKGEKEAKAEAPPVSALLLVKQLAVALLFIDGWVYFWHRFSHENSFVFKHVHHMHHHLVVPYAFGAQYIHPVDALFSEILGSYGVLSLSGMAPWTATVFFCVLSVKAVDDHCGKWFPKFHPIHRFMLNNSAFHAVHHKNWGLKHNYSVHFLTTWDFLLGTYLPYTVEERNGGGYQIRTPKDE